MRSRRCGTAGGSHSERSTTNQVKVCVQVEEGLTRQRDQTKVKTGVPRISATRRNRSQWDLSSGHSDWCWQWRKHSTYTCTSWKWTVHSCMRIWTKMCTWHQPTGKRSRTISLPWAFSHSSLSGLLSELADVSRVPSAFKSSAVSAWKSVYSNCGNRSAVFAWNGWLCFSRLCIRCFALLTLLRAGPQLR